MFSSIQYREETEVVWFTLPRVTDPPVIIGNLQPWTLYRFKVATDNAVGSSPYTTDVLVRTPQGGKSLYY